MPALVTEKWTEYKFRPGDSASRVFWVTGVTDQNQALLHLSAQAGVYYGSRLPLDNRLFVAAGAIDISRKGVIYVMSVSYGVEGGFSYEPNPINEKWKCSQSEVERDEAADSTWNGKPVVNSSAQPLEGGRSRRFTSTVISMSRYESSYNLGLALAYQDKINLDAVTLPKFGTALPGQLICRKIKILDEFEADTDYLRVGYTFEARPLIEYDDGMLHGFHDRRQDIATEMNVTGNIKKPIRIKDSGEFVAAPVAMNGYGIPLDSSSYDSGDPALVPLATATAPFPLETKPDGVFLLIDQSEGGMNFAALQIEANL